MPTIIALNPQKRKVRKKSKSKSKPKKLARKTTVVTTTRVNPKKRGASMAGRKRGKRKIKRRRNPSRGQRAYTYARGTLAGINVRSAAKSTIPLLFGAISAKFVAKRFADGGAETDNWTWKNYLLGLAGGFGAALITSSILKTRVSAQKVMEGAFLLIGYKFFTNELAPKNATLEAWFGQDDDFDPYAGNDDYGDYGDIWRGGEQDFVRGLDGNWRPTDESHRLPEKAGYGDIMVDPDPRFGDIYVDPDSRYGFGAANTARAFEQDGM